ncbi:hypothetical protein MGYG_03048 [Nannizzia gypsea CBS 118893]|uniref:Uncharacterized protein n=1 Tax=Arthroderma gypseum (strain ATCC MYA-4604 / CBS 118893) TaxID=535722 RepID=E4UQH2_ARTGP|nr:hypothetical protein MGYG_03048 [Nannizzia gypsea CBS 118893]EFR00042.1 hypothetical protein MGYG_03048 [Nannizzia gypsea CBS 118893]
MLSKAVRESTELLESYCCPRYGRPFSSQCKALDLLWDQQDISTNATEFTGIARCRVYWYYSVYDSFLSRRMAFETSNIVTCKGSWQGIIFRLARVMLVLLRLALQPTSKHNPEAVQFRATYSSTASYIPRGNLTDMPEMRDIHGQSYLHCREGTRCLFAQLYSVLRSKTHG